MLRRAVAHAANRGEIARRIDAALKQINAENPTAFHVEPHTAGAEETLSARVFQDQPVRSIPMKGFVKHVDWDVVAKAA